MAWLRATPAPKFFSFQFSQFIIQSGVFPNKRFIKGEAFITAIFFYRERVLPFGAYGARHIKTHVSADINGVFPGCPFLEISDTALYEARFLDIHNAAHCCLPAYSIESNLIFSWLKNLNLS